MAPRIAIPIPHSTDREYGERAIPQYERAVVLVGGEPVRIPLDQSISAVKELIRTCDAVLLPGSNADVDPAKFHQNRSEHTAAADARREDIDFLLLDDACAQRKPVLGICYGLQSLNVYHGGSLVQHIPDFLPEATRAKVNHEAGKKVAVAHTAEIKPNSFLAEVLRGDSRPQLSAERKLGAMRAAGDREGQGLGRADQTAQSDGASAPEANALVIPVNSSHHQSADKIGRALRIVAHCPDDGIIEALEGTSPDHFVLAVQWHPERSVDDDATSLAIFQAFVNAAKANGDM
jgi:putative glutamine amidotransferase